MRHTRAVAAHTNCRPRACDAGSLPGSPASGEVNTLPMRRPLSFISSVLALTCVAALAGAPPPAIFAAAWRAATVMVDGDDGDWTMPASEVVKTPLFMSVVNDDTHVYVRLRTSDPSARMQLVRGGLIVSFDPTGRDKRVLALKYPVGMPPPQPDAAERRRRSEGDDRDRRRPGETPPPADAATPVPNRVEIYGPGRDDARSLVLDQAAGIEVRLARQQDSIVYELKVPLVRSEEHPFAVGARPGSVIGVGLESPKVEMPSGSRFGGPVGTGGRPGGGMMGRPGGGMGGGRPGRGGPEEGGFSAPKSWKVWTTVQLARQP